MDAEQKISVKERTQRFNRLASVEEPSPSPPKVQQSLAVSTSYKKRFDKVNITEFWLGIGWWRHVVISLLFTEFYCY